MVLVYIEITIPVISRSNNSFFLMSTRYQVILISIRIFFRRRVHCEALCLRYFTKRVVSLSHYAWLLSQRIHAIFYGVFL